MTVFLGNVIDMFISGSHIITEPANEFFAYSLLTFFVVLIFILLAKNYIYVEDRPNEQIFKDKKRPLALTHSEKAI